jgi:hypothetical protein
MRGERYALRIGEYLVARACRRLPAGARQTRYREWAAELPAILHDRDAGPAPRRVLRMLTFAADTLRGTALARGSYRYQGAHAGKPDPSIGELAIALLALFVGLAAILAWQGWIVYQLIFGASLFANPWVSVFWLIWGRIRRSDSAATSWFLAIFSAQGIGLLVRALASELGWGHPLLFAIISYCGYAFSIGCLYLAIRALRLTPEAAPG